jgi:response regulator RpfG family c-di-GMP phosphodiesterase
MTETILFVDDDIQLVSSMQRSFARTYRVELALGAQDALAALAESPYAVVVSDLQMPGMNGIELLTKVKDLSPETVRILLTGAADLHAAIDAVNEGSVFRFLQKPCPQELLKKTLDAGLAQYRLQMAERDVLQETLVGTVAVLTDLLANLEPAAFGRASRLRWCVRKLALELKVQDLWQFEAAAMLSQIGCIPMAAQVTKQESGVGLTVTPESGAALSPAREARRLLERVPRLHTVAQIIERQNEPFETLSHQSPEAYVVGFGAQMLRVAMDFDKAISQGRSFSEGLEDLRRNTAEYHPDILNALGRVVHAASAAEAGTGAVPGAGLVAPVDSGAPGAVAQALP